MSLQCSHASTERKSGSIGTGHRVNETKKFIAKCLDLSSKQIRRANKQAATEMIKFLKLASRPPIGQSGLIASHHSLERQMLAIALRGWFF